MISSKAYDQFWKFELGNFGM